MRLIGTAMIGAIVGLSLFVMADQIAATRIPVHTEGACAD